MKFIGRPSPRSIRIQAQCVWCGDDFWYWSTIREGIKTRLIQYCSRSCISEVSWEGRRKLPSAGILKDLYVKKNMSMVRIAKLYKCDHTSVSKALRAAGIPTREHTVIKSCRLCGSPVEKKLSRVKDKSGMRVVFGAYCRKHNLQIYRDNYHKSAKLKDHLIGTRKHGRKSKPTICRCGVLCESARQARDHCRRPRN